MSTKYTRSISAKRTGNRDYSDNFIQIRITYEAYHMLSTYMYLKHGRVKGRMPYIVSDLIIKAITNEMPEIVELKKKYGSYREQKVTTDVTTQTENQASTTIHEMEEAPAQTQSSSKTTHKHSIYERWMVKYAGVIRGIKNMKTLEKEAKEAKFLLFPINNDTAVVIDRYWVRKAIELGNHPQYKITLSQAEEIARQVIEGGKSNDELTLKERVALALATLNRDGSVIYASNGWTLTIPDIALDVSEKAQAPKPEAQKTEEKRPESEAKPEPKKEETKPEPESKKEEPKQEDMCSEKKIPEPADIEFMHVGGAVEQITIRECTEKKGLHFYMVLPELGIVVNPAFETSLLEKIRSGQVKYTKADIDNAVENYAKNRSKPLNAEEKEKILMKALLQETKIIHSGSEWRVVDKPKTGKAETRPVKTGSMIDNISGQGV